MLIKLIVSDIYCSKYSLTHLMFSIPYKAGTLILPILQMKEPRLDDLSTITQLAQVSCYELSVTIQSHAVEQCGTG